MQEVYRIFAQDFLYTDADNLLTFFDNHDMARGIFIADKNMRKIQQVLIMLLTTRGISQILYGTEINMIGGESHTELRADFPGGFPGHNRDAFTETGRTNEENEIFHYLRDQLHLRKTHKALTHGKMIHYPPSFQANVYKRIYGDEKVLVMVNGHQGKQLVDLSEVSHWFTSKNKFWNLMTGEQMVLDFQQGIFIEGWGTLILQTRE